MHSWGINVLRNIAIMDIMLYLWIVDKNGIGFSYWCNALLIILTTFFLVQDYGNSSANALELLQSCIKPLISYNFTDAK